jgi:maltose O-acetyltransferase
MLHTDPQLSGERRQARLLMKQLNDSRDDEVDLRHRILQQLI